ncbi:hypothetical protein [Oligoflexus tunisiensis]|uniref:hypothetical protein n=1 Tax=Oligoflexus tunisiensis TaxID=708132 RepID=UPI00114C9501|nr:hypothetical protein [Oligoflexus tunisiensis]
MKKLMYVAAVTWMTISSPSKGDESANLMARRSELQRQKEEIQRIDIQATRVANSWQRISSEFQGQANSLQSNLSIFIKRAAQQSADMDKLSKWMSETYQAMKTTTDPAAFRSLMEDYRSLKVGSSCGKNIFQTELAALLSNVESMSRLRDEATYLTKNWSLPPDFDEMKNSVITNRDALAANFEAAKKAVLSVMPAAIPSDICDTFLQFDVVISLSQTVAELNKASAAIDAINLDQFLKHIDDITAERNLVKQVRRLATSMAARNISNIRAGKVNETLQFSATYRQQLEALIAPIKSLKFVAEAEKNDAIDNLGSAAADMARELDNSKIFTVNGKRSFHLTRTRNVHTRLFKLNSTTLDPVKTDLYEKLKAFCLAELGMTPSGRYTLPTNLDFEQSVKLDASLAKAQDMLKQIDGVEI